MQLDGTRIRDVEANLLLSGEVSFFNENVSIENKDGSYLIDEEILLSHCWVEKDEYAYDYPGYVIEEAQSCFRKLLNDFFEEYQLLFIAKNIGWCLRIFKDDSYNKEEIE